VGRSQSKSGRMKPRAWEAARLAAAPAELDGLMSEETSWGSPS